MFTNIFSTVALLLTMAGFGPAPIEQGDSAWTLCEEDCPLVVVYDDDDSSPDAVGKIVQIEIDRYTGRRTGEYMVEVWYFASGFSELCGAPEEYSTEELALAEGYDGGRQLYACPDY